MFFKIIIGLAAVLGVFFVCVHFQATTLITGFSMVGAAVLVAAKV